MTEKISEETNKESLSTIYPVSIDKIRFNEQNDVYTEKGLDDLKQSIEQYGLKEPLSIVKDGDGYRLIAGHRRLACIKELFKEGKTLKFGNNQYSNKVPCIFENTFASKDEEFLNLIASNKYRDPTPEEIEAIVKKCSEIYERNNLKQEGVSKRDAIAKMACVSPRTVDKYLKKGTESTRKKKLASVSSITNKLNKLSQFIEEIELEEYGKTDRNTIQNVLNSISEKCLNKN